MYLAGITPEDFIGSDTKLARHAKQIQLKAVSDHIEKTVLSQSASALKGFMYTIRRDPTVQSISDSLFIQKTA